MGLHSLCNNNCPKDVKLPTDPHAEASQNFLAEGVVCQGWEEPSPRVTWCCLLCGGDAHAAGHHHLWAHPHPWMLVQLWLLFSARAPLSALTLEPDLATPRSRIAEQITPASDCLLPKHQCHPLPKAVMKTGNGELQFRSLRHP